MSPHLGERLCPLVDGQLRHDERDRALAHLANCSACRQQVAEYRRMKQRLAGLWEPALPERLADRLLGLGGGASGDRATGGVADEHELAAARRATSLAQQRPLTLPGRTVAFGPAPRQRLIVAGPRGRVDRSTPSSGFPRPGLAPLFGGGLTRPRRRSRVRRTLVSSAALMVLTVSGAAAADTVSAAGGSPAVRPTVPASHLPAANGAPSTPQLSTVSYALRR